MNRKYTYHEVEKKLREIEQNEDDSMAVSVEEMLRAMRDYMKTKGLKKDDRCWDWDDVSEEDEDAYDRAMRGI